MLEPSQGGIEGSDPASVKAIESELSSEESSVVAPDAASQSPSDLINTDLLNTEELYIDPTSYSIGATQNPNQDVPVILLERSTGCEAILQPDQAVSSSLCNGEAIAAGEGLVKFEVEEYSVRSVSSGTEGTGLKTSLVQGFYNLTNRPSALLANSNLKLMFPLSIPAAITSAFGWRLHPVFSDQRFHTGTDFGVSNGTPVVAAVSGQVISADFMQGYGLTIILQHNEGSQQTLYAHLSELFIEPGEQVKQGEVIGRVGSTGTATGPNLHFELHEKTAEGWEKRDPGMLLEVALAQFLKPSQPQSNDSLSPVLNVFSGIGKAIAVTSARLEL